MQSFSLVLPCYNEAENITEVVAEVMNWAQSKPFNFELVVVDDGSNDGTAQILNTLTAQHKNLTVVTHTSNQGYGAAVRTGCDRAQHEWIGFMDSDRQFKVSDFDKLLAHLNQYDLIVGRRRHRADPLPRKFTAKAFGILVWSLLHMWIRDINCAMKVFKRSIWPTLRPELGLGGVFNAELFYRAKQANISWKQVDVRHFPRLLGQQSGGSAKVIGRAIKELWSLRSLK